jgi:hypothetical protein
MLNVIENKNNEGENEMKLETGLRIYYTGDMANDEGFGTITELKSDRWGDHVEIQMDDGREINVDEIAISSKYEGHGGTRFVTIEAFNDFGRASYEKFTGTVRGFIDAK